MDVLEVTAEVVGPRPALMLLLLAVINTAPVRLSRYRRLLMNSPLMPGEIMPRAEISAGTPLLGTWKGPPMSLNMLAWGDVLVRRGDQVNVKSASNVLQRSLVLERTGTIRADPVGD